MRSFLMCFAVLSLAGGVSFCLQAKQVDQVTYNHITWRFDKKVESGTFITGDPWVVGPVKVIAITNDLHSDGFTPNKGQDGSEINPKGGGKQGYDDGNKRSYDEALNAALPGGNKLSAQNPLTLRPGDSLVSMVSWLYHDKKDREPGCPRWYATNTPRPALHAGAVLTCLPKAPPKDAFRPPYCGKEKPIYRFSQLKLALLKKLKPVAQTPDVVKLEQAFRYTWFDDCSGWGGAVYHPSLNMPNYGRNMGHLLNSAALMVHLDFDQLPRKPRKDKLVIALVQFGIDLTAMADTGAHWGADGGHCLGRKWPILFAGLMLDNDHMKNVGHWENVRFQDDETTFYVSQETVDITNGPKWKPDKRAKVVPYGKEDIGTAEWGIRHQREPNRDNKHWSAKYRDINNSVYPGTALAALIMGQKKAWNHPSFFDYVDRVMKTDQGQGGSNHLPAFQLAMWKAYRDSL